jgi:adenine-specific DNA-methyltransferase
MSAKPGAPIFADPQSQDLLGHVDFFRYDACRRLSDAKRTEMGQFLTPTPVARLMASMFECGGSAASLLDAGAGVGSLTAAWVSELCARRKHPNRISVTAYEVDAILADYLSSTLELCRRQCESAGIQFEAQLLQEDFIQAAVGRLLVPLFRQSEQGFDCAILNPPYRKIHSESEARLALRSVGIETSNLYTAFLALVTQVLKPGGELVAITPRSFCNGPYFRPFRELFLRQMVVKRLHVFESRSRAFQDDDVLQENVILHATKGNAAVGCVTISSSEGPDDDLPLFREAAYSEVVNPEDPGLFIHIVTDDLGQRIAEQMAGLSGSLKALGLRVSTGRVVDFRAARHLRLEAEPNTAPLIYPHHFSNGFVAWPKLHTRKHNAILIHPRTIDSLVASGTYVLIKRFSSKEERRRVVAAIFDPERVPAPMLAFENHLNYYHMDGKGLPRNLAVGLAIFLNSTLVDLYFRNFNGHTQVNAADLRVLPYPTRVQLERLATGASEIFPSQNEIDRLVRELLMPTMLDIPDPVEAKKKIEQAIEVLKALGFPRPQQNERSALTLLALLDLKPSDPWSAASDPLRGVTQMMEFFAQHYGRRYAPNSRETVRRQTIHQFRDAGLVLENPDNPLRPTNSGQTVYQIEPAALQVFRAYGTEAWIPQLKVHLSDVETLSQRYVQHREMQKIPLVIAPDHVIALSPGGQNVLMEKIITEFCPRFTPGGKLIYVGDTAEKFAYFDVDFLAGLGVSIEPHGKMPDVVVHYAEKDWLVLIEAVTSHGPVSPKRHIELQEVFRNSKVGLVFVTAFLTRKEMVRFLGEIAWETEVWVAEAPTHMIHFNGERFLGPY